jgi:hypothetical protein
MARQQYGFAVFILRRQAVLGLTFNWGALLGGARPDNLLKPDSLLKCRPCCRHCRVGSCAVARRSAIVRYPLLYF